ncbi:MAG: RagB/SusD family nutrient uptake outer membrane protein [Massilibacteroides sp.]|nr:RagB/SusD family nutrient uptake outer membrane protein [Massilibacteroides sp.]
MKTIKLLTCAFCLGLVVSSCSDDFLENEPIMKDVQSTYYSDDAQMYNALIAAYDGLQLECGHALALGEIRSDNARTGGGSDADGGSMPFVEAFTNTVDNAISNGVWERGYKGIYRANLVINADYTSEETEVYKAEAKFIRAWQHFDVLRVYGPCPISLETIYPEDMQFTRNTRQEVYTQIEKDLLEAIPVLKESFDKDQVGRITKSAAQALLGKTYLYWADWSNDDATLFDKAKAQFEAVVASGQYQLMNNYANIFNSHSENNTESVFEIQHATTSGAKNKGTYGEDTEGAFWMNFVGPRGLKGDNPDFYVGWGFMLPTKHLQESFLVEDSIRKDVALLDYDEVLARVLEVNPNHSTAPKDIWDISRYGSPDWQGAAQGKYEMWKDYNYVGNRAHNNPGNEKIIRYADVLLMLAEANLRGSSHNEQTTKELINQVRKAHMGAGGDDYLSVDQQLSKYNSLFSSVLDVLWYERRVELACEGDRWYDLVRSGRAEKVMSPILKDEYGVTWEAHDLYLPIGSVELAAANGSLEAYPNE